MEFFDNSSWNASRTATAPGFRAALLEPIAPQTFVLPHPMALRRIHCISGCHRSNPNSAAGKRGVALSVGRELSGVRQVGLCKRGSLAQMVEFQSRPWERTPPCENLPHFSRTRQVRLPKNCRADCVST